MFTRPAVDLVPLAARAGLRGSFASRRTRVRGLPEFGGEFPVAALAEEIETTRRRPHPRADHLRRQPGALRPERRAARARARGTRLHGFDRPVPERDHAPRAHHPAADHRARARSLRGGAARRSRSATRRSIVRRCSSAPADRRHDWEIFAELTGRIGGVSRGGRIAARASRPLLLRLRPERFLDVALRIGPHRLSLRRLKRFPHGIDLGPLVPCLPERLYTPDRRDRFGAGHPRPRRRAAARAPGRRVADRRRPAGPDRAARSSSNNSWMHNVPRLVKGRTRCTLRVNPADAARLRLTDGGRALVRSAAGSIVADVEFSDEMMAGVVSLPHGWAHAAGCQAARRRRARGGEHQRRDRRAVPRSADGQHRVQRGSG